MTATPATASTAPADVAVVGGGLAGLVAASRCAQLGLSTVLLEKGAGPDGDSNSRISTGLFHLAWHPLDAPAGELEAALIAATDGDIEPGIARALAASASATLQWLVSEGVTFAPNGDDPAFRWQVTPHGANVGRRIDGDRGTYRMVRVLYRNLAARGAAVHHASRVTALAPSAAGWRLTVDGPAGGVEARKVVLCDGGFQASAEMLTRYIGPQASGSLPAGRLVEAVKQRLGRAAAASALIGVPIVPGITVTMGGLAVRADGAVRADDGSVLPGLYACGSACGGIHGGPRGGYLGGLAVAAVTAWNTAATIGRTAAP